MTWWTDFSNTTVGQVVAPVTQDFVSGAFGDTSGGIAGALGGIAGANIMSDFLQPQIPRTGYQGKIPEYEFVRDRVPTDPDRRTGGRGQRYFTDTQFAKRSDNIENRKPPTVQEAQTSAAAQRAALAQRNLMERPTMAQGGIAKLAQGRYLDGSTDGMADVVPARIDGGQEARLSDGEFVIPADVVSHLGNGNSDAGAKQLHNMMDDVRQARTGRKAQGIEINPDKFVPKMASGGIARFSNGDKVEVDTGTDDASDMFGELGDVTGTESSLSSYVGPYVTDMLGRGMALADKPYEAYEGVLQAGPSALQSQAFTGIAGLQPDVANMGVKTFDATAAQQYMNPYLQAALDPQLKEAARQSEIQRQQDASRLTRAGAFGGSRQAIIDSERSRNLADLQADITGREYRDAYNQALSQFNREQDARNKFGFDVLGGQSVAGATQRGIEQGAIDADIKQFEEERDFPYKSVQYMQSLLQGLPLEAQSVTYSEPSQYAQLLQGSTGLQSLFDKYGIANPFANTQTGLSTVEENAADPINALTTQELGTRDKLNENYFSS
jgi:hypothetical protein